MEQDANERTYNLNKNVNTEPSLIHKKLTSGEYTLSPAS